MDPHAHQTGRFADPDAEASERNYAMATHLVGLLTLLDMGVISFVGTIIMWRIRAADSPFLDDHGREAVNFHLSLLFLLIVGAVGGVLLMIVTLGIGVPLVLLAWVLGGIGLAVLRIVGSVMAAIAANKGEFYRYPMCVRFLKGPAQA